MADEKYFTRHESEEQFESHRRVHSLQEEATEKAHKAHDDKHTAEGESVRTALAAVDRERNIHALAHDKEHSSHYETHKQEQKAVETALAAVARERDIHASAHDKAHESHNKEHQLNNLAITKADQASEIRFTSVNEFRGQLGDVISTLASKESVDAIIKDNDRRWEENRKDMDRRFNDLHTSIINIEKGDVKQEGKGVGQGMVIAIIVASIGLVGTILGIVVVIANLLTSTVVV